MKPKEILLYSKMADAVAYMSYCKRNQVGAVIVHGHTIVYGYNGTPAGEPNDCEDVNEDGTLVTKSIVIHAEANALLKLGEVGAVPDDNTVMFCTLAPCTGCAEKIVAAGIKTVYYTTPYRCMDGVDYLRKHGVLATQTSLMSDK